MSKAKTIFLGIKQYLFDNLLLPKKNAQVTPRHICMCAALEISFLHFGQIELTTRAYGVCSLGNVFSAYQTAVVVEQYIKPHANGLVLETNRTLNTFHNGQTTDLGLAIHRARGINHERSRHVTNIRLDWRKPNVLTG